MATDPAPPTGSYPQQKCRGFDPCSDDGPFDEAGFAADGHHDPSRALLLLLGRAIAYECGYGHEEAVDLLATVRWHKGYSGEHPTKYDLCPCDEDGTCLTDYDDDGNEIILRNVQPTTWGIVKTDAPSRRRRD